MRRKVAAALAAATLPLALPALASPAGLDTEQAALDREAEQAVAESDRLFHEAEDVARRYGVDITPYRQERTGLHRKRQEALVQSNYMRARMFEALLASNTGNTLEEILPHLPSGPERQRYQQRMQQSHAAMAAFKASLAPSAK